MPEFILNAPARPAPFNSRGDFFARPDSFDTLNTFERGYVEAMFFTNGDTGDENENRLNDLGVARLTRKSIRAIKRDCRAFTSHIMPDGCFVSQWLARLPDYSEAQAGRDFWFTRQGHGVGFWDRKELEGDAGEYFASACPPAQWTPAMRSQFLAARGSTFGDHLTRAAKAQGESDVEVYRGWIHIR